ncbi:glycosyltransferase [Helicobacter labetoulli]|uniref:glycosyltransferase n=1 Tax=Helicobacter labetoulli TaxID=2315333 RepID=UPI000EF650E1|nr:glycosyltransferase [Helicobacter labetoulli]
MSLEIKCFKLSKFQLLGSSDCNNPSAISKEQILAWEKQGIIEYLGETKDVRPFVESASCVVLPSSYKEGVPRVLLEAMSMGKAIIATNIAGCKECVAPPFTPYENLLIGQNGILIPPKDTHALSLAMTLLASNTAPNLAQMGANARAFVKGRFDVARIVRCYKRAVSSCIDSALLKKHRLMPNASLVLGSHSADFGDYHTWQNKARNENKNAVFQKVDSSGEAMDSKETALCDDYAPNDSKNCGGAVVALTKFWGRSYLGGNDYSQNLVNQSHCLPKAESPVLAFVSNTCFGMYNFRLQVLKSLQKSGFAIHIIAPFDASTQTLNQEGFTTHNIRLDSRSLNPFKDLRTTYALYKLLRRIRPALVFNYTIKPAIYSSSVCNALKIPNIAIITGLGYVFINDKGEKSSLKKSILRFIVCQMYRFALKATQEVWFLNNDDKQEFLARRLISTNQAFLLDSEGVDTEYFCPKKSDVKAQKQETQGEIVFLLVARMLWDKGVGEFVEAAKMVQESMQKANKIESNGGGA